MDALQFSEYQCILDILKQARKKQRITQKALAKALRRSQPFVAKYEMGELRLDIVEFVRIARLLGLNPARALKDVAANLQPLESDRKYGFSKED
ncbi:MAG: helix-turn-helix domain-containing protein [Betaproteobacteria bacterium]|nr:helix-turn-helix domain-containing protein [Betaproteobacteria bacterium]